MTHSVAVEVSFHWEQLSGMAKWPRLEVTHAQVEDAGGRESALRIRRM
jgi:hypothetical protein